MDLRSPVKNVLRMCGHAVVSTVHDRLNGIERALRDILDENTELASTQTALLQSGVHVVEKLAKIEEAIQRADERVIAGMQNVSRSDIRDLAGALGEFKALLLEQSAAATRAGEAVASAMSAQTAAVAPAVEKMVALGDGMRETAAASLAVLQPCAQRTMAFLSNESVRQVCVETSDYVATNPELGLFEFLYSFLPSRKALDIGAHAGEVSNHLLKAGYEVYAFEPCPETYRRLHSRLTAVPDFHPFQVAIGNADGQQPLYSVEDRSPDKVYGDPTVYNSLSRHGMPADLPFHGESVIVPVRTLAGLHAEGRVPDDVGLVKVDTEGFDLEVIRGMREYRYPAVMVEFWDSAIPFGGPDLPYTVETLVAEMRARQYLWYIVLYRVWGEPQTAFFCNHDRAVPNSWGNVIFFRDREIFDQAQKWCAAVLPRTYFKPMPVHAPDLANYGH
jgi:FkbM family methyltransferase